MAINNYGDIAINEGDLSSLYDLIEKQANLERAVLTMEDGLKVAKQELRAVSEEELPSLMQLCGIEAFTTKEGLSVSVKETIRASIPKNKTLQAMEWLRSKGHEGLIKHSIALDFGRGEDEEASALYGFLIDQGLQPEETFKVHPQTLGAFVREQLAEGEDLPMELLGVHRQTKAKIKGV